MGSKNWIFIKRGLSEDPKHRERMGNRIWLYIHILDRVDWETGMVFGWRDRDEAEDMGMPWRTLQQQRQELHDLEYIECIQKKAGLDIRVFNWVNPRNYSGGVVNPKSQGTEISVPSKEEGTEIYVPSEIKGTVEGTVKGTVQVNRNLRTPTYSSSVINDDDDLTDEDDDLSLFLKEIGAPARFGSGDKKRRTANVVRQAVSEFGYTIDNLRALWQEALQRATRSPFGLWIAMLENGQQPAAAVEPTEEAAYVSPYSVRAPESKPAMPEPDESSTRPVNGDKGMRADQVWQAAMGELQLQMSKPTFETWVKPSRVVRYERLDGQDIFVIGVPSENIRDWLETRLLNSFQRSLTGILGRTADIRFVTSESR